MQTCQCCLLYIESLIVRLVWSDVTAPFYRVLEGQGHYHRATED